MTFDREECLSENVCISVPSGSPYYDNVRPLSYPDSDAVLICFDVSRPETLDSVLKKAGAGAGGSVRGWGAPAPCRTPRRVSTRPSRGSTLNLCKIFFPVKKRRSR